MGQQVPFETLGLVVRELANAASDPPPSLAGVTVGQARVSMVPEELPSGQRGGLIPTVRVGVELPGGERREIDLFEGYWAVVTAGRVRLADALLFYARAGWRGLRYALGGRFERRVGRHQVCVFPLGARVVTQLAFAFTMLVALTVWILLAELAGVSYLGAVLRLPGFRSVPLGFLTSWAVAALALTLAGGGIGWLWSAVRGARVRRTVPAQPGNGRRHRRSALLSRLAAFLIVLVPVLLLGLAGGWLAQQLQHALRCCGIPVFWTLTAIVAVLVAILLPARRFLIEYTGDVAAYMSAHEVSRFAELRSDVQARCCRIAEYVYRLRSEQSGPLYDEIVVIGHSLGSVVAYDVLNELLVRHAGAPGSVDVAARTRLLLTFGSPLDKIATIFRSQKPDEELDIREDLAVERQPMLLDRSLRPQRWVNLYHPTDWIGGAVDYYDLRESATCRATDRVVNVVEPGGTFPPLAHSGYWTRGAFRDLLLWAAAGARGDPPVRRGARIVDASTPAAKGSPSRRAP